MVIDANGEVNVIVGSRIDVGRTVDEHLNDLDGYQSDVEVAVDTESECETYDLM
jgi:alkyl hydroperoxide reductase subunit AhpC